MDLPEFRRRLAADPLCRDPELRAACERSPQFAAEAAAEAAFEERLQAALRLPVDEAVVHDLARPAPPGRETRTRWWLAAAALAVVALAVAVLLQARRVPDTLPEYLAAHYHHDGPLFITRAEAGEAADLATVLARFGVAATPELARQVAYVGYCPSLTGIGAHLVLNTEAGWRTVFYLPGVRDAAMAPVSFDGLRATLLELPGGLVAVIGPDGEDEPVVAALVRDGLVTADA